MESMKYLSMATFLMLKKIKYPQVLSSF